MGILKLLLISVVLVGIILLALAFKMLFDKNAKFTAGPCCSSNKESSGCDCRGHSSDDV